MISFIDHMKNLESVLKKHYTKQQNKIVFKNKLTLNQLANLLWEKEGLRGIDPSALSRIISGERNFTLKQIDIFCEVLSLSKKESLQLKLALEADILAKHGFEKNTVKKSAAPLSPNLSEIENSVINFSSIEDDLARLYRNIYEGGSLKVRKKLQTLLKHVKRLGIYNSKYGAYLFNQITLIYIRCLTDIINPEGFQRLIYLAENNLDFSQKNPFTSLGVSFRTLSLTKRMYLLTTNKSRALELVGRECLNLSLKALRFTDKSDHSENLRNHWEVARVALALKNQSLFDKHVGISFNILPKLKSDRSYLESMTWDLKARGELRFNRGTHSALESIKYGQKINKTSFKTVSLYLSVTKSQALQKLKRVLPKESMLASKSPTTPYEQLRYRRSSLIGL